MSMKSPSIPENDLENIGKAAGEQAARQAAQEALAKISNDDLTGKAAQAQQAAGMAQQAWSKPTASPLPGITPIPFEDLDTSTATAVAMGASHPNTTAAQENGGGGKPTLIGSRIYIGETAIEQIISLQITQVHGTHHELKLRFFQDQAQSEGALTFDGAEKLLGQVAEIELFDRNNSSSGKLQHIFVIADVQFEQDALNEGILSVTGYAPTWILDGSRISKHFTRKTSQPSASRYANRWTR